MDNILLPWATEVGLIAWRTVRNDKRPPYPSELLATFVVFGAFGLVSAKNPAVGSLLGWGIVVATFLKLFDPTNPTLKPLPTAAPSTLTPAQQAQSASAFATAVKNQPKGSFFNP